MFPRLLRLLMLIPIALPAQAQTGGDTGAARLNVGDVSQGTQPDQEGFAQPSQMDSKRRLNLPEIAVIEIRGLTLPQTRDRGLTATAQSFAEPARFSLGLPERRLLLRVGGFVRTGSPAELPAGADVPLASGPAGGLLQGAQLDRIQPRSAGRITPLHDKRFPDIRAREALPMPRRLNGISPADSPTGDVQIDFGARTLALRLTARMPRGSTLLAVRV
jgi:protein involved in polysaccharide export with SLBB domain